MNEEQVSTAMMALLQLAAHKEPTGGPLILEARCGNPLCPVGIHAAIVVIQDPIQAQAACEDFRRKGAKRGEL